VLFKRCEIWKNATIIQTSIRVAVFVKHKIKKKRYLIQYSIRYFAIVSSIAATAFFCANQKCPADDEFKPIVVIKKKFPAIKAGEAKSFADADQILLDDELVIGVEING